MIKTSLLIVFQDKESESLYAVFLLLEYDDHIWYHKCLVEWLIDYLTTLYQHSKHSAGMSTILKFQLCSWYEVIK
jgi:hypothetical protein